MLLALQEQLSQSVMQTAGFTFHVDLGQIIIATLIGTVGFFVKRMLSDFEKRIDRHETILFQMAQNVQFIMGALNIKKRQVGQPLVDIHGSEE